MAKPVPMGAIRGVAEGTVIPTRVGSYPVESLTVGVHEVLTKGGIWTGASFKNVGWAPTCEVELSRSGVKKRVAVASHLEWRLLTRRGKEFGRETQQLCAGDRVATVFPSRPDGRSIDRLSVARGFVFGDGSMKKNSGNSLANFCGSKDEVLIPFFAGLGNAVRTYGDVKRITGLPREWKASCPSLSAPVDELYGWLAGYFAADGDVGETGRPTLASASRANLEFVRLACHAVGVGTFGIRARSRCGFRSEPTLLHLVGIMRRDLDKDFFVIPSHQDRFLAGCHAAERRGWNVVSVNSTGISETVFSLKSEARLSFVIEDNILIESTGSMQDL